MLRPARRTPPRCTSCALKNTSAATQEPEALLVHRVLPLERLRRHDQLPAQLLAPARSRSRRQHHLSQDRVPRAAQSLRVLPRERRRSRASTPTARPSSASTTAWSAPRRRRSRAPRRTRSPAAGRPSPRTASTSSSRPAKRRPSSSSSATSRTRAPRSGRSPASSTRSRAHALIETFSTPEQVAAAMKELSDHWSRLLSNYSDRVDRREAEPDGQHLEPLPVHGHVQHVAQRLVLRDGHRPRHGVPRLEPGPARASSTWCRSARASGSSTSPPRSSPTAAPTTSTSRSPSAATTTSAAGSTTIRSG